VSVLILTRLIEVCACDDDKYTPETHLPTPGQRRHSPQRHTTAGTAAPPPDTVYGPTLLFIVVVSPCRCEPLRAGCCGGERVLGVS